MALAKLSNKILLIRGRHGGVYFKHDNMGQHIQAMPRSVRKGNMTSPVIYHMSPGHNRAGGIRKWSGMAGIWLLALLAFYSAAWAAFALIFLFTTKTGERKKITGYNWFMHNAMMFPEEERPPLWIPPHKPGELPDYIITYRGRWTYEHTPVEWPAESPADYYWDWTPYNGKPTYITDNRRWLIWWKDPMWVISEGAGMEPVGMTFYSPGAEITDRYQNPVSKRWANVYIGKAAE